MRKVTSSILLLLSVGIAVYALLVDTSRIEGAVDAQPVPAQAEQQILSSTIQILMILVDQNRSDQNGIAVYGWRGLGTLARHGTGQFILTHGHWPIPSPCLIGVELSNSVGERLLLLDADTFLSLVRYRDSGTMILQAPEQLPGIVPATLGNISDVAPGDTLWLAAYEPDTRNSSRIVSARVEVVELEAVPSKLQLRGPCTTGVALGDSGGGLWLDGKLIGNLCPFTTNAIESTFATVKARTRTTKGAGSRAAGLSMALSC